MLMDSYVGLQVKEQPNKIILQSNHVLDYIALGFVLAGVIVLYFSIEVMRQNPKIIGYTLIVLGGILLVSQNRFKIVMDKVSDRLTIFPKTIVSYTNSRRLYVGDLFISTSRELKKITKLSLRMTKNSFSYSLRSGGGSQTYYEFVLLTSLDGGETIPIPFGSASETISSPLKILENQKLAVAQQVAVFLGVPLTTSGFSQGPGPETG